MGSWQMNGVGQDVYEAIIDLQNQTAIAAFGSVRNTDALYALAIQTTVTTIWGESASTVSYCNPGQDYSWNSMTDSFPGQVHPPYTKVFIEVKAKISGQNGTYTYVATQINTDA